MPHQLLEPLLEAGIRNTHFFNGRILDADALTTEQQANRRQHAQLGRAAGEGIVCGLEVSIDSKGSATAAPVLKIRPGLAMNRSGQALELTIAPDPMDCTAGGSSSAVSAEDSISLVLAEVDEAQAREAGLFGLCRVQEPTVSLLTGVSLLVLSPASGYREKAPLKSLSVNGNGAGCGDRYAVEGVSFRLVGFPADAEGIGDLKTLRSRLAYRCYGALEQMQGTSAKPSFGQDPFNFAATYGAIDALRADGALTDCDVPLALLYQTNAGLVFCDMWAVRRPYLLPPLPVSERFPLHVGTRRQAESMAMFLQFQDQLTELYAAEPNRAITQARTYFRCLPPAGYLPVKSGEFAASAFFTGLTTHDYILDTAALRLLVATSWYLDPIDLASANPPSVRLYEPPGNAGYLLFVREENSRPVEVVTPPPADEEPETPTTPTKTGSIRVIVSLKKGSKVSLDDVKGKRFSVVAIDEDGDEHPGDFQPHSFTDFLGVKRQNEAHFLIAPLPEGKYTVRVRLTGFDTVSKNITLAAGQHRTVNVELSSKRGGGGKPTKPERGVDGKWLDRNWYGRLVVLDRWLEWREKDLIKWRPQPDPPPDARERLEQWGLWFQNLYPDAPIDAGGIRVLIDPEHTPDRVANDIYAVLEFGEGGAYVPVALTAGDKTLDRPVSAGKGGLPGVDAGVVAALKDAGIDDLSVLAAVPANLLAEVMEVSPSAGQGLVTAARGAVDALENSVLQFDGVNDEVRGKLEDANIDTAIALANADIATVTGAVGDAGFAQRLVEQARASVAAEFWSLDSPQVGLTGEEVGALRDKGVFTLGQVAAAKNAGTAGSLGISGTLVDAIAEGFAALPVRFNAVRVASTPVTSLSTVGLEEAGSLSEAGFNTVDTLASATSADLAPRLGGSVALAERIIAEAKTFRAGGAIR